MDELMLDPATAAPWLLRLPRRVPGPVGSLECSATHAGGLMFAWKKPAGSVDGYRIERTRDGHEYEMIEEG